MFLHNTKQGQKEVERFICQGCQLSLPRPDPKAGIPTMQLVAYWTSHKEIRDLYRGRRLSRISCPLCGAAYTGEGAPPCWKRTNKGLLQLPPGWSANWSPNLGPGGGKTCTMRPSEEAREAHQWALEDACMLEWNIERLSQGMESTQYPHPYSYSSSHLQSRSIDRQERSLDRHERSPSWHGLERCVTFWDPEVEPASNERPYRGSQGHPFRTQLEGSNGVLPPVQRQEMVCPQEMSTAYLDTGSGMGYPPEPSIRNYKKWLDW